MEYRIAALFFTSHADTVGNSIRLNILEYLSQVFKVVVFTNQKMHFFEKCCNVELKYISDKRFPPLPILGNIGLWKKIASQINKEKIEFVFLFHDTAPVAIWLKATSFQYVHQIHEMIGLKNNIGPIKKYSQKVYENLILRGLKKSTMNFVVSQSIIDYLKKKNMRNLSLIPHGVTLSKFREPLISDFHRDIIAMKKKGKFIVSYVGWVSENRGLNLILDSLKEVGRQNQDILFVIVGSEPAYIHSIANFVSANRLEEKILSYGRVDHDLIPGILAYSDVCLSLLENIPAYEMSPPQKIIEYFAAGKPVIANQISTHELLIKQNYNGFIINYTSLEISNAILKLYKDRPLLTAMASNASNSVNKYDFDIVYGKMISKMKNLVELG